MISDKIIIRLSPTEPFQRFYVYQEGEKVESLGVKMEDFSTTLVALIKKYNIHSIDISGNHIFSKKIIEEFLSDAPTDFVVAELTIKYL